MTIQKPFTDEWTMQIEKNVEERKKKHCELLRKMMENVPDDEKSMYYYYIEEKLHPIYCSNGYVGYKEEYILRREERAYSRRGESKIPFTSYKWVDEHH
jgi:hypothetical protein